MGEITNNATWWDTTTTASDTSNVWFSTYAEPTWVPYVDEKYEPKWHIAKGYKNQLKHMWD